MTDFDPNAPRDIPDHPWGTYVPSQKYGKNRQEWKTHRTLRDVRSAIDNAHWGLIVVYTRVDGVWIERVRFDRDHRPILVSDKCYVCGGDDDNYRSLWEYWSPDIDFEKVSCHFGCKRKLGVRKG